jgi:Sec-independent protein translocase protein TatA
VDTIGPWELLIIVLAIGLLVGANGLRRWPAASAKASANSAALSMRAANPATQRPRSDSPPER